MLPAIILAIAAIGRVVSSFQKEADIEHTWDPTIHNAPEYWDTMYPALDVPAEDLLSPDKVRSLCRAQATEVLDKAIDLVDCSSPRSSSQSNLENVSCLTSEVLLLRPTK